MSAINGASPTAKNVSSAQTKSVFNHWRRVSREAVAPLWQAERSDLATGR